MLVRDLAFTIFAVLAVATLGAALSLGHYLWQWRDETSHRRTLGCTMFLSEVGLSMMFGASAIFIHLPQHWARAWIGVYYGILIAGGLLASVATLWRIRFATEAWAQEWGWTLTAVGMGVVVAVEWGVK